MTSSPPTTSDSLLASASVLPASSAREVARSPAAPTSALRTTSASGECRQARRRPRAPASTVACGRVLAARLPRCGFDRRARGVSTPNVRAPAARGARRSSARRARRSRSRSGCAAATSSAWRPIEPVEPRTATRQRVAHRTPPHHSTQYATRQTRISESSRSRKPPCPGSDVAGVLDARLSLHARLGQVADDGASATPTPVTSARPSRDIGHRVRAERAPRRPTHPAIPASEALPRLLRRDVRRQLVPAEQRADEVRAHVVRPTRSPRAASASTEPGSYVRRIRTR